MSLASGDEPRPTGARGGIRGDAFARDLVGEELPRRICVAKKALKLKISLIFKKCPENPWIEATLSASPEHRDELR